MSKFQPESSTFPFEYTITRTKRRTLAICVKSGNVHVRAPANSSSEWVESFIQHKQKWICRQIEEQRRKLGQRLVVAEGSEVPFFGRPRQVRVAWGGRPGVEINDDRLCIITRDNRAERLERIFQRWLRERAREYMVPRTLGTARLLGVEQRLKDVVFRKTRSKWGHCSPDGTIQYNWLVMMAPREVVDYLVAHECGHLLHMNHSKQFWAAVARVCPDYRDLRHWLRENGHRFWSD